MTYDAAQGLYTHRHLLKQGYYNYHYAVREQGSPDGDPGELRDLEGHTAAQTNNLYTLVVHYEDWDGYDRVIGLHNGNQIPDNIDMTNNTPCASGSPAPRAASDKHAP